MGGVKDVRTESKGRVKKEAQKAKQKPKKKVTKYAKKWKIATKTVQINLKVEESYKDIEKRRKQKLNKKRVGLAIISLMIIIIMTISMVMRTIGKGNLVSDYQVLKTVRSYLGEADIAKAEVKEPGKEIFGERTKYKKRYVAINFEDEKGVTYYYGVRKEDNQVVQSCHRENTTKGYEEIDVKQGTLHSEKVCYM